MQTEYQLCNLRCACDMVCGVEGWTDSPFYVIAMCIVFGNLNNSIHSFGDR